MKNQEKNSREDNFSSRLSLAISSSGLKQKELAKMVGVAEITISRYKNGTQTPNNATLNMLASVLNVSPAWLSCGEEAAQSGNIVAPTTKSALSDNIDWKQRALNAEERLARLENILNELFAFARIGQLSYSSTIKEDTSTSRNNGLSQLL